MKSLEIAGGLNEDGIVVGNTYDKYGSSNPVVKWMMAGFENALEELLEQSGGGTVHEIGCGEGRWTLSLAERGFEVRGSDFSSQVIELAHANAKSRGIDPGLFTSKSIYNLDREDHADVIVCCEVLEHLENPKAGLEALHQITDKRLICSVPREPIWRMLNFARGKYIKDFGNTPGHLQHWSHRGFVNFVSTHFEIIEVRRPLPWTMLLCSPKK